MTLVTIQLPGQFTFSQLRKLFSSMHMAMRVIRAENRTGPLSKITEPPHAFTTFNTAGVCANDAQWNAGALEVPQDARPSLREIRALRLETLHKEPPQAD